MSVSQNKGFWQMGPDGTVNAAGGGGGAITPVFASYDDQVADVKPASITAGSVTMNGNVWEVADYTSTATKHNGFGNSWRISLPLPADILDGTSNALWARITITEAPSLAANMRFHVGIYDIGIVSIGGGLEIQTNGTDSLPIASKLSATTEGPAFVAGALTATVLIQLPGDWNNSNNVGGSAAAAVNSATVGLGAAAHGTGSAGDIATSLLCVAMGQGSTTSAAAQTVKFTVEYAVVALPA